MMSSFQHIEDANCPICVDYIIGCRVAICGHTFCNQCLTECLLRKKICPVCRKDIRKLGLRKNRMIDESVKSMAISRGGEDLERWKNRQAAYKEWKDRHRLNLPGKEVKIGEKVDVRDTEYIWCVGTVELKISTINRKPLLYVHYNGWNRKYDEFIYINSDRLAPSGTYTQRADIPHYNLYQNQNVMQASIVEGGVSAAQAAGLVPPNQQQQEQLQQEVELPVPQPLAPQPVEQAPSVADGAQSLAQISNLAEGNNLSQQPQPSLGISSPVLALLNQDLPPPPLMSQDELFQSDVVNHQRQMGNYGSQGAASIELLVEDDESLQEEDNDAAVYNNQENPGDDQQVIEEEADEDNSEVSSSDQEDRAEQEAVFSQGEDLDRMDGITVAMRARGQANRGREGGIRTQDIMNQLNEQIDNLADLSRHGGDVEDRLRRVETIMKNACNEIKQSQRQLRNLKYQVDRYFGGRMNPRSLYPRLFTTSSRLADPFPITFQPSPSQQGLNFPDHNSAEIRPQELASSRNDNQNAQPTSSIVLEEQQPDQLDFVEYQPDPVQNNFAQSGGTPISSQQPSLTVEDKHQIEDSPSQVQQQSQVEQPPTNQE